MTVYVYRPKHPDADKNGMVPFSVARADERKGPYIISDNMQPLKHHGTGRIIDSKSAFRNDTKASGCIEIGTEVPKQRQPISLDRGQRREAIRRSIYELRNGYRNT